MTLKQPLANGASIIIPNAADFNDQLPAGSTTITQVDLWSQDLQDLKNAGSIAISKNGTVKSTHAIGGWKSVSGTSIWQSWDQTFANFKYLKDIDLTNLNIDDIGVAHNGSLAELFANDPELSSVKGLDTWNLRGVQHFDNMFANDPALINLDVSGWNLTNSTSLQNFFANMPNLQSITGLNTWNVSHIQNFADLFSNDTKLVNVDLSGWKFDSINLQANNRDALSLNKMFENTHIVNANLSGWDFSHNQALLANGTGVAYLGKHHDNGGGHTPFSGATIEHLNASGWKFPTVTSETAHPLVTLAFLFDSIGAKTIDVSNWQGNDFRSCEKMFGDNPELTSINGIEELLARPNYVQLLTTMFIDDPQLSHGSAGTDGLDLSKWQTHYVQGINATFAHDSALKKFNIDNWYLGSLINRDYGSWLEGSGVEAISAKNLNFDQNANTFNTFFGNLPAVKSIDLTNANSPRVTGMAEFFANDPQLTAITDLRDIDTDSVTTMDRMFYNDRSLSKIGDLSTWKTGNVTTMSHMFANGDEPGSTTVLPTPMLTEVDGLDNWDVSNVQYMDNMFANQTALTKVPSISTWRPTAVQTMANMFLNDQALTGTLDWQNVNAPQLTNVQSRFENTGSLNTVNLSNWQTPVLTSMVQMFYHSGAKNISLKNWDLSKIKTTYYVSPTASYITSDYFGQAFAGLKNPCSINLEGIKLADDAKVVNPGVAGKQYTVNTFDISDFTGDQPIVVLSDQQPLMDLNKATWFKADPDSTPTHPKGVIITGRQNSDYLTYYQKGNPVNILGRQPMDFVYHDEAAFDQAVQNIAKEQPVKQAIGTVNAAKWQVAADIVAPATSLKTDWNQTLPSIVVGRYPLTLRRDTPTDQQKTVIETIKLIYDDGQPGTTKTVSLNFIGYPNEDGDYDWVPANDQFSAYPISVEGYHIISATRTDTGASVLNAAKDGIQAITGITHDNDDVTIEVHLAPNDQTKTIHETLTTIYDDGSQPTSHRTVNSLTFIRRWNDSRKQFDDWTSPTDQFDAFRLNIPSGYHVVTAMYGSTDVLGADGVSIKNLAGITPALDHDVEIVVHLTRNSVPAGPENPGHEAIPWTPLQPAQLAKPADNGSTKVGEPSTNDNLRINGGTVQQKPTTKQTLPQTGNSDHDGAVATGLFGIALAMFGLGLHREKRH